MEFKLVGCCYHRGYPASHSALPLLPFLMGHQNYSQSQVMNQVRILVQILISPFFPHFWMYARYPSTHFGIKTGTRRSFEGQVRLIILALKLNPEVSVSWYIIKWFNRFLLGLCFTFSPPLSQPHALSAYFAYIWHFWNTSVNWSSLLAWFSSVMWVESAHWRGWWMPAVTQGRGKEGVWLEEGRQR